MALAEVRAAWQRTANRCFVQEDAKRAPKLACCSSAPPSVKQTETEIPSACGGQEIPTTCSIPFNPNPSYPNLSPSSRWWLQMQPNYGYQKGLVDGNINSLEPDKGTCQMRDRSDILAKKEDYFGKIDQSEHIKDTMDHQCRVFATCEKKDIMVKDEELKALRNKNCHEHYLNSDFPWIETGKNIPWWRTTDTEDLALLVSQRSHDLVQNCDLPAPQNTCVKKDKDVYIYGFNHDGILSSDRKSSSAGGRQHLTAHKYTPGSPGAGDFSKKLRMSAEVKTIRDSPMQERMSEMQTFENGMKNAQLLEALRHSQTRAREAEKVAKRATAEKQEVLKLVLRQASQLFMYRQWLQLLQLESMYFQLKNNKSHPDSPVYPMTLPWIPQKTGEMMKSEQKHACRKRNKRPCLHLFDVNKYAVVFALGMGLVGAGFILGWTIGWLLPAW